MDYAYQMKQLADANGWAYVDLTQGTKTLFESYGSARCENELQSIKVKDGVEGPDGTHFRSTGALLVARLCAQMMKDQGILADNINIPTALSVSPETGDMGDVYNGQAAVKEFTLNGFGLEPSQGTISVTATDGVKLSTDKANWQDALSIDYTSGTIVQNFYARATMTTAGAFSSTITVTSGSTNIEVPLTANVVELGGGEPFTATWALTENMTPVVEGNATATDVVISNMGSRMKNETLQAYGGSSLGSWSAGEDDDPSMDPEAREKARAKAQRQKQRRHTCSIDGTKTIARKCALAMLQTPGMILSTGVARKAWILTSLAKWA